MILPSAAAVLLALAAPPWHDGTSVTGPCAMAQAGYQPTAHAGQVFYGRAVFSGSCGPAELDVIPPPGVIVADTDRFPIKCFVGDGTGAPQADPTCPTHTVDGTYGPQAPAGDAGGGWSLAPGQTIEVDVPLVSARPLHGAAGGPCPQDVGALAGAGYRDCLLVALHAGDQWLLPDVEMSMRAGKEVGLSTFARTTRARLLAHGLVATVTVPAAGASATLTLRQGGRTLARVTKRRLRAGDTSVRLRVSARAGLHPGKVVLVERLSSPRETFRLPVTVRR